VGKAGEFSRYFVLKVTLQSVRFLLTVSYRQKLGEQDVLVAPPIILTAPLVPVPVCRIFNHGTLDIR